MKKCEQCQKNNAYALWLCENDLVRGCTHWICLECIAPAFIENKPLGEISEESPVPSPSEP